MDIKEIKAQLAEFKNIKAKGAITPESLGALLENMLGFTEMTSKINSQVNL